MITERAPRNAALRSGFCESDLLTNLPLPPDNRLHEPASALAFALEGGTTAAVHRVCGEFLRLAAEFYGVKTPAIRVLAARPPWRGKLAAASGGEHDPAEPPSREISVVSYHRS